MSQSTQETSTRPFLTASGALTTLSDANRVRLSVFLVKGNDVLGEAPLSASGSFQLHISPELVRDPSVFAVLGPKGQDPLSLDASADLPRISLSQAARTEGGGIDLAFANVTDALIEPWWIWCQEYTISGSLETAAGCTVSANVTIYNVTTGTSGLVETPIAIVPTDGAGNFTATFLWCSRRCWWPCWPIWWDCWPWWWELDILEVIDNIEQRLNSQPGVALRAPVRAQAPLRQPAGADLITGLGFASSRAGQVLQPDPARTALIKSKFSNVAIRELFPWWWWCCENPNIVFSATQGTVTVLDEDPNISTRWCFASGQTVSLTANAQAAGACPVAPPSGDNIFTWLSVGAEPGETLVSDISMGYANGALGSPESNMAFTGTLVLNAGIAGATFAYYQVLAAPWVGTAPTAGAGVPTTGPNPARWTTASPGVYATLSTGLSDTISVFRAATLTFDTNPYTVNLGPFNYNSQDNLYLTRQQAAIPSAVPASVWSQLGGFPTTLNPGDQVFWDAPNEVIAVPAASLVSGTGGVSLTIWAYDLTGALLTLPPFDALTLMIDTDYQPTTAIIDGIKVYDSNGNQVQQSPITTTQCPGYQIPTPTGYVLLHVTVVDDPGHLCEYSIVTQYGQNTTVSPTPSDRDYAQIPSSFTNPTPITPPVTPQPANEVDAGYGTPNSSPNPPPAAIVPPFPAAAAANWSFIGGGDTIYIPITVSCCYDFQLWLFKRITDGHDGPGAWRYNAYFQTANIVVGAS